jgi:hypothetical protein
VFARCELATLAGRLGGAVRATTNAKLGQRFARHGFALAAPACS